MHSRLELNGACCSWVDNDEKVKCIFGNNYLQINEANYLHIFSHVSSTVMYMKLSLITVNHCHRDRGSSAHCDKSHTIRRENLRHSSGDGNIRAPCLGDRRRRVTNVQHADLKFCGLKQWKVKVCAFYDRMLCATRTRVCIRDSKINYSSRDSGFVRFGKGQPARLQCKKRPSGIRAVAAQPRSLI
jgi:hypothetical protein